LPETAVRSGRPRAIERFNAFDVVIEVQVERAR
jgi:hypothetical protein